MIKALQQIKKQDRERFVVPRSVQQTIPITRLWEDGIWLAGGKYSKCWRFSDINYAVASKEDQSSMYMGYCELLNSLDSGAETKITLCNRKVSRRDFESEILMPLAGDDKDKWREIYNKMLSDKAATANNFVRERYITVSAAKRDIAEARTYFARVNAELESYYKRLSARITELDAAERLRLLHDFYRAGEEGEFSIPLL